MFSRAIVATDLSPASEGIVACAGALGVLGVKEAVLVYAMGLEHGPSHADDEAFARQAASLESVGIQVHVETPLGYAPHAITTLALERSAGLIVMGTTGKGLFHTGFSGSVSSDVVRLSPVPVLLGPAPSTTDAETGGEACARLLASVLVPVDLGPRTGGLCELAFNLNRYGISKLTLLHVLAMDFGAVREHREVHAEEEMERLAEKARHATTAEVEWVVVRGAPDMEVPAFAASGGYTLVVLAPRCHDTIDEASGSVTSAVIRTVVAPVLLSPPGCDTTLYPRGNT